MGLVIIFLLVTVLSVVGLVGSLKNKNVIAILFSVATILVFGWFSIMTLLNHGYPAAH